MLLVRVGGEFVGLALQGIVIGVADRFDHQLETAGIPAGPINRITQAINDVQAQHRQMVRTIAGIPLVTALVSGTFCCLFGLLVVGMRAWLGSGIGWGGLRDLPAAALSTAIFGPPIFRILAGVDRYLTRDPRALASA